MENSTLYREGNVLKIALHIAIGGFIGYYTIGVFNTCQKNVSASLGWGSMESTYITVFSSFIPIGQTIGSAITAPTIAHYGRRKALIFTQIIYMLGTIILVMPSTVTFGIGRFMTGFSAGIYSTINPIFINEVTPLVFIPKLCPLYLVFRALGLVFAYAFGLMLPLDSFTTDPRNDLWLFMFLFPGAVTLYQFCYFFFFMKHDSPQFYFSHNRLQETKDALAYTHKEPGMEIGLARVSHDIAGKIHLGEKLHLATMIFKKKYSKMTRMAFTMPIALQFCGITAIYFYSTLIFENLGGGLFLARLITVIMGIVNVISSVGSIYLLRYFGRKTVLLSGFVLLGVDLFFLGLFSGAVNNTTLVAIFLIGFYVPFGYSLGATFWVYLAEIMNDQIMSLAVFISFAVSILVSFVFPVAVKSVGIYSTFYFFAVCMVISFFYALPELIETKGKGKDKILTEMKVLDPARRASISNAGENRPDDNIKGSPQKENNPFLDSATDRPDAVN